MNGPLKFSCPHCRSREVFRSHRRGFIERYVLLPFRMRPYRCIKCDTRFYALLHFQTEDASTDKVA
jgi:DNA-directed RNA polymerase subunit RPC12/RpoP